jgi:ABC-2 type transport system permease protein
MKYLSVASIYWKAQMAWRFDVVLSAALTVSRVLLASILWGAIYAGRDLVAGLTLRQMLTYYVVCAFLRELDQSSGTCGEFAARIRHGSFSAYMVRPVRAQGHFFAQTAGVEAFYGMFQLAAMVLWVFALGIDFSPAATAAEIFAACAMAALGLAFMAALNFLICVFAFRFSDVSTFSMIKDSVMNLATGALLPLSLMPAGVVAVMRHLPFYYVAYLPSMLVLGRETERMARGMTTLAAWTLGLILLGGFLYERERVRYDGVGI